MSFEPTLQKMIDGCAGAIGVAVAAGFLLSIFLTRR